MNKSNSSALCSHGINQQLRMYVFIIRSNYIAFCSSSMTYKVLMGISNHWNTLKKNIDVSVSYSNLTQTSLKFVIRFPNIHIGFCILTNIRKRKIFGQHLTLKWIEEHWNPPMNKLSLLSTVVNYQKYLHACCYIINSQTFIF